MTDRVSETPNPETGLIAKVLLATPVDMGSGGIGSLFLRDLIASLAEVRFTVKKEPQYLLGRGSAASKQSLKRLLRAISTRVPGFHSLRLRAFQFLSLHKRVAALEAVVNTTQAECVWVTASSVEMIWIAQRLAASGHDVRVTVWDAPEYLSANLRLDAWLRRRVIESFESLLKQARAVSVIGRAMQQEYLTRYGVRSEIIRHGINADLSLIERTYRKEGPLRIIFAGSLYSKDEWNSFVFALDSAGWQVAGRPVLLNFMGRFPLSGAHRPKQVILLGEKSFDEALRVMSSMDIGYLPYWFDERHKLVARTSFPGKLSAYAAAGLAVFHHAPPYTEPTAFLKNYPFGLACPSLEGKDIMHALTRLVELADTNACRAARVAAVREELSREAMAMRFRRFLGQ